MSERIFIKPADEKIPVRDPQSKKPLAKDGEWKPAVAYWLRRRDQGDVVNATPPKEPAPLPLKS